MLRTGSAVADGTGSTRRTRRHIDGRLGIEQPLAIDERLDADHQLGQAHKGGRALATLDHGRGSLLCRRQTSAEWRGPWPRWWTPIPAGPPHPPLAQPRRAHSPPEQLSHRLAPPSSMMSASSRPESWVAKPPRWSLRAGSTPCPSQRAGSLSGGSSTLVAMPVTVGLPPAALRRLEAEAARRGVGIDEVTAEVAEALPADTSDAPVRRRKLAIAGIGASGGRFGRAADADELLADGFGRS